MESFLYGALLEEKVNFANFHHESVHYLLCNYVCTISFVVKWLKKKTTNKFPIMKMAANYA